MNEKTCTGCGAAFPCGADDARCWCMDGPPGLDLSVNDGGCLCPECLVLALRERHGPFPRGQAGTTRPAGGLRPGVDYRMEQGKLVFSAWYLFKRGFCCGNGCRNCPYDEA